MQSHEHFSVDTISREQQENNNNIELLAQGKNSSAGGGNSSPNQIIEKKMSERLYHHVGIKIMYELSWLERYSEIVDIEGIRSQIRANMSQHHGSHHNQGQQ